MRVAGEEDGEGAGDEVQRHARGPVGEAGLALALSWSGVASPFGVTASLLARLREIFYIALGVIAMLIKGSSGRDEKNPAEGTEAEEHASKEAVPETEEA